MVGEKNTRPDSTLRLKYEKNTIFLGAFELSEQRVTGYMECVSCVLAKYPFARC